MTAELTRGQNHPLPRARLEIRVSAGTPVVAGATLGDENGTIHGVERVVHPGAPTLPGLEVSRQAAADHRLAVDLDAVPDAVHRVSVLLALPAGGQGPARFGAVAAPFVAVTDLDGDEVASYTITGLEAESAVVALELYRRQGAWKVRAVGQGYAGGLAELLADQKLSQAHQLAATIHEAVASGLARSIPAPPAAAPAHRPDHGAMPGAGPGGPVPPASPYDPQGPSAPGPQTPGAPGRPGGQQPYPSGPGEPATAGQPSAPAAGGPIDYSHPRRQSAAPPPPPPAAPASEPGRPARPVAGDATGWSMEERLYNQVWGMFEDLARTTAAYRSAVDFADSRMEKELDQVLSDPRSRIGGQGDAAREAARARHGQLVSQAREVLDRDVAQLVAEAEVVEPALPAAFARWDNPVWHAYRVPMEIPMALRLGDLHLPEADRIRIPMLIRLPLERGLWIDSGRSASLDGSFADSHEMRRLGLETAVSHAARLLAVYPAGEFTVHVIDPAGSGAQALAPLAQSGVLAAPPAQGAAGAADVLARLTQRVDLVQMALRGGAPDALPPGLDTSQQLLIVNDFPHGFDDRAVNQLRYLADEGPAVGVHLMMVADREESAGFGPLLDPLWRSLLRLTPVADDHLADPWVGHAWTYEPSLVPPGSQVLQQVLAQVAAARRSWDR
ncbi:MULTISPECIES: TerD family protein [Streptomyces]|uniref:Export associated protein n=1 Tax=Streptomyces coelicolor (strain ATCC BAA-471 / A3(2) / M145) TaxID=100226 RepID=Q9Z502_STRCO|nr:MULTISPECIES: TerD family protein [Streptomyces]MDX2929287.1 TerD family protein [Streptomyces sp. NRRL_B-16638]MDX3408207.1 TerD family protein [Streptomyces sp. ME02-6977A]MYU41490.1 export associated protein [Streptomyces sp. SID7813]NSL79321.1 TerD family protein [Streptomyces coelicolor]QFI42143.1 TerD family protein [Streptomyces coelicolor A3(2)]